MKLRLLLLLMIFPLTALLGCASRPAASNGATSKVIIKPITGVPKLNEAKLREFESSCQLTLPADYRRFLLQHNGSFPTPDCVTFKEGGRRTATDVLCFHGIGGEKRWASLEWHLQAFAGRLPKETIPIGHDSCGNLWLLRTDSEQAGAVVFWDHGSFDNFDETDISAWPRVADSFQAFLDGLQEYEPLPEENELLSRYALVQKATEGMVQKSPDFSKSDVLNMAWHCHYSPEGSLKMECVKYEVHAIATHTDGYSNLRAAKGLIKSGKSRLPK